jgi:hypothetical protein
VTVTDETLQDAILGLCEHLLREHTEGGVRSMEDVVNAVLGWHYDTVDPDEAVIHRRVPVQEKLEMLRHLWAVQPSGKGQNPDWSALQTASRPIGGKSRLADQTSRPLNEQRALELLAGGGSNNEVLTTLKAEGYRLDRNRLKGLRAEARAMMT